MILKSGDMEKSLSKLAYHIEEPRVGQSYPNYYAAELASKHVKVVLSGALSALTPLALMAIFCGSWVAIGQIDVKRLLAYSSIAQIGYMVLGLSLHNVNALTGAIIHLFNHALMKGALFLAMGCVVYRLGSVMLDDLSGLGRRMPWTMAAPVSGTSRMLSSMRTSAQASSAPRTASCDDWQSCQRGMIAKGCSTWTPSS